MTAEKVWAPATCQKTEPQFAFWFFLMKRERNLSSRIWFFDITIEITSHTEILSWNKEE